MAHTHTHILVLININKFSLQNQLAAKLLSVIIINLSFTHFNQLGFFFDLDFDFICKLDFDTYTHHDVWQPYNKLMDR